VRKLDYLKPWTHAPADMECACGGILIDEVFDWWGVVAETARDSWGSNFPRLPMRERWDAELSDAFLYAGARVINRATTARSLGRCMQCGGKAIAGRTFCETHAQHQRDVSRRRYHSLRSRELCVMCGGKALDGRPYCAHHAAHMRERSRALWWERLARGQCPNCGKRWTGERRLCNECHERQGARSAKERWREEQRERRALAREAARLRANALSVESEGHLAPLDPALDDAPRPRHRRMLAVVDQGEAKLLVHTRIGQRQESPLEGER